MNGGGVENMLLVGVLLVFSLVGIGMGTLVWVNKNERKKKQNGTKEVERLG